MAERYKREEIFGERIRQHRLLRKWSQEELGKRLGIPHQTVGRWERGEVLNPKMTTVVKLANLFNVSIDYLFDNKEKPWN